MSNFHTLEVVGRGSATQLQMGENVFFLQSSALMVNPVIVVYLLLLPICGQSGECY